MYIFCHGNARENVLCRMVAIWFRPQWLKLTCTTGIQLPLTRPLTCCIIVWKTKHLSNSSSLVEVMVWCHYPTYAEQLRQPRIWCSHYLPPGSLLTVGASESFSYNHVSLIWYKIFSMTDISYRLIWMKFINMLSVYALSGTHRRFNWCIIAVLT